MSTTAPDLFTTLGTGWTDAARQWLDQSQRMWDQLGAALGDTGRDTREQDRHHHHGCDEHTHHGHHEHGFHHEHEHPVHHEGCHCAEGSHDHDCHCHHRHHGHHKDCCGDVCECCVPQADVVVHARVGERRVIPFRLHNAWRREREVTLAVGPWHVCSGEGLVVVAVLEEESLVLKPCEDRIVRLGLAVMAEADAVVGESGDTAAAEGGRLDASHRFTRDLDACASAYADVRFEGCARPQRIAVVVRPTDCDAVGVTCDCGCC